MTIEELVLDAFGLDTALCRFAEAIGTRVGVRVPAKVSGYIPAVVGTIRRRPYTTGSLGWERTFDVDVVLVAARIDPREPEIRILSFDVDRAR